MSTPENFNIQDIMPEVEPYYVEGIPFYRLRFPDEPKRLPFAEALMLFEASKAISDTSSETEDLEA